MVLTQKIIPNGTNSEKMIANSINSKNHYVIKKEIWAKKFRKNDL